MKQLMLAMKRAQAKRAALLTALVLCCIVVVDIAIMNNTDQDIIVLAVSFALVVIAGVILHCFCCFERHCLKKVNKLVATTPGGDDFFETFNEEMEDQVQPNYYSKEYQLSIFATDTWFVLISANDSIIRRCDSLLSAERQLVTSDYTHAAKINFADGYFLCRCDHICENVIEVVRNIIRDDISASQSK